MGEGRPRVLVLCTHNSARSQMAEGFLDEVGIGLRGHASKRLDRFLGERWDYVVTVCDQAGERCPVFPGPARRIHLSFEDPSAASGSEEERLRVFRSVRDQIAERLRAWLAGRPEGQAR